jgi:hypothetical protein
MVFRRQRKQWSACEEANGGCMVTGEVWVDPLRHRARRGTEDEKSRQGGLGFLEHGFEYSNQDVCCSARRSRIFEVTHETASFHALKVCAVRRNASYRAVIRHHKTRE